jgi:hypothetical protein
MRISNATENSRQEGALHPSAEMAVNTRVGGGGQNIHLTFE